MIALALLGLGLLVIGGALPIGARYLEESANLATGEAAVQYGLDLMEQALVLRRQVLDPVNPNWSAPRWETPIFVPRETEGAADYGWEPIIKVRPLPVDYVLFPQSLPQDWMNWPEGQIASWLGPLNDQYRWKETCPAAGDAAFVRPPLPMTALVFPPLADQGPWDRGGNFFDGPYARPLRCDPTVWAQRLGERRVSWVGFYRRVAYGPGSDPRLYELIVFAVRRPTEAHRFPAQTVTRGMGLSVAARGGGNQAGDGASAGRVSMAGDAAAATERRDAVGATDGVVVGGVALRAGGGGADAEKDGLYSDAGTMGGGTTLLGSYNGTDVVTPLPWLVTFTALPQPPLGFDLDGHPLGNSPTLNFRIDSSISGLFPVGTLFLPARNDDEPGSAPQESQRVGLGPPAPTALPLYKVVGRPDDTTVVVENNGFFPRRGNDQTPLPGQWPVWVIPPAFAEKSGNVPIFDGKSPVLSVGRRYVRLREVP